MLAAAEKSRCSSELLTLSVYGAKITIMPEWVKKLFLMAILIAVIVGSFWVSFLLGKQMLLPTKSLPPKLVPLQATSEVSRPILSDISIEVESKVPVAAVAAVKPAVKEVQAVKKAEVTDKYNVQVGAFKSYSNAQNQAEALKKKGFSASVSKYGSLYRVLAKGSVTSIKAAGFDAVVR